MAQNGSATTAIVIGGVEDLGGGMKALFRYELNPDFANGSGLTGGVGAESGSTGAIALGTGAAGYHFLGLEGGFGKVLFGRLNTGSLAAWGAGSTFGTALGSGYGSNGNIYTRYSSAAGNYNNTAPTRFNGAVEYTTPVMGGFSARLMHVPQVNKVAVGGESACAQTACTSENGVAAGANRVGVTDISVAYSKGPLNVVVASQTLKVGSGDVSALVSPSLLSTASTSNKLNTVGANYNLGFATVRGGFWTEKTGTTVNTSGYQLGASYPMGAVTLHASIANSNDKTAANVDKSIMGLGADYALSKRTAVYGRYENRDADTSSAAKAVDAAASGATKTMHVGVRHTF
jgi:predicted porin